jgi:hypothetical protein
MELPTTYLKKRPRKKFQICAFGLELHYIKLVEAQGVIHQQQTSRDFLVQI